MADQENPLELFRHALAGATRAIAGDPEVEVGFTSDAPSASGKTVKAPMPGRTLGAREVAEARGFADAAALRLRHHNGRLHARGAPADDTARAVFDAAEQARCEALGARSMAGVRENLARLTELRLKTDPLIRARNREEVPLASAVGLIVRERLTGAAPPPEAKAGPDLVGKLLRDLELVEGPPEAPAEPEAGDEGEGDEAEGGDEGKEDESDDGAGRGEAEIRGEQEEGGEESDRDWSEEETAEASEG